MRIYVRAVIATPNSLILTVDLNLHALYILLGQAEL